MTMKVSTNCRISKFKGKARPNVFQLIKSMSNSDHKLHNVLPKKVHEIRNRETRQNSHMYYNFKWRTERFKNSPISYAISKYNEKFFV